MFSFKKFTILCAALCTASSLSLSAFAAERHYVLPEYSLDRISAGKVIVHIPENEEIAVQIYQHSPEQENLLFYDTILSETADTDHIFSMESGDYTITLSAASLSDGSAKQTLSQDFTIENPDFSDTFTENSYHITVNSFLREDTEDIPSQAGALEEEISEGVRMLTQQMDFSRYDRILGDYNNDGLINIVDAMSTLTCYNLAEIGAPVSCTAAELASCDIYPDGVLSLNDAMAILTYYNLGVLGLEQNWDFLS